MIILVDDRRYFKTDRNAKVVKTSNDALKLLKSLHGQRIDELWLDHDLGIVEGEKDTTRPVEYELSEKAFHNQPYDIGTIYVHTSNRVGSDDLFKGLKRYGYNAVKVYAGDHLIDPGD